jgi:hypothetical protein
MNVSRLLRGILRRRQPRADIGSDQYQSRSGHNRRRNDPNSFRPLTAGNLLGLMLLLGKR